MRYVVTTGFRFTDIDAYACCIAYAELLRAEGKEAIAVLPGVLNESVIPQIREWKVDYTTEYIPEDGDIFVLQDISEKSYFAKFVLEDKIHAVYDHHFGFEKEWEERLGERAHIEKVGACATLIVEEAVLKGLLVKLSETCVTLLYTAIFANSLNLKASVTSDRDIQALRSVEPIAKAPEDWRETYFSTMQAQITMHPIEALKQDFKILSVDGEEWAIGQLELWNGAELFNQYKDEFQKILGEHQQKYAFVTVPSIKQGVTFVQAKNMKTREILEQFGLEGNRLPTLRLRKEWIKLLMSSPS